MYPSRDHSASSSPATLTRWAVVVILTGKLLPGVACAAAAPAIASFDLEQRKSSHWAWKPIAAPTLGPSREGPGGASAIDALLADKLQAAGLHRAPPADKRTLIRRATFDLIGLPPAPDEVEAFQKDSSADAFAKVVDRLLASPHFGERWARHWLDVVRYSETLGHESDFPLTKPWRYRDYVIRALNADLPYDQFVREHIAGDLLDPPRLNSAEKFNESIIATAFWYMGEATHAPVDSQADQATRIDNQVDVLSKAFLGLTVACARCHDHKFDAISTMDYYALAGYAASSHQQVALLDVGGQIAAGVVDLKNCSNGDARRGAPCRERAAPIQLIFSPDVCLPRGRLAARPTPPCGTIWPDFTASMAICSTGSSPPATSRRLENPAIRYMRG